MHFASYANLSAIFWDNSPFLYNLLLKFWLTAFGDTEVSARFLSVLFSTGSTVILIFVGRLTFGFQGAVTLGVLHALCPLSIIYAQETRPYALFEFACALNLYFLIRSMKKNKYDLPFYSSIVFMCLSHYIGLIPAAFQILWIIKKKTQIRKHGFEYFMIGLGIFIIVSTTVIGLFHFEFLKWQELKFMLEPESRWPRELLSFFVFRSSGAIVGICGLVILAILLRDFDLHSLLLYVFAYALWTIITFEAVSFILKRAVFIPRYYIFLIPPWLLFITHLKIKTAQKKSFKLLSHLFLIITVLGASVTVSLLYHPRHSPWREVALKVRDFPKSMVVTTRSSAIQTPYFEWINVPVEHFDDPIEIIKTLETKFETLKTIWIVEPIVPGTDYFSLFKKQVNTGAYNLEDFTVSVDNSEPIVILKIEKKL